MSIAESDAQAVSTAWRLSETAAKQMEAIGVDAREVLAVLERPQVRRRVSGYSERLGGYGLTVVVDGWVVRTVGLDGADRDTWEAMARERALAGQGADVPAILPPEPPAVDESTTWVRSESAHYARFRPRLRPAASASGQVRTTHVLDSIHPALRASITEQVDGDFSRLLVHSPTKVEILPLK